VPTAGHTPGDAGDHQEADEIAGVGVNDQELSFILSGKEIGEDEKGQHPVEYTDWQIPDFERFCGVARQFDLRCLDDLLESSASAVAPGRAARGIQTP
jgi:hypothetical protein